MGVRSSVSTIRDNLSVDSAFAPPDGVAMQHLLRLSIVSGICMLGLGACDSHSHAQGADEYVVGCETVDAGEPAASDESFTKFVEAEAAGRVRIDAAQAPVLNQPAPGSTISIATPPEFSFCRTPGMCALPRSRTLACRAVSRDGWLARLGRLVSLEQTAHAHCGAFSGENYFFVLRRPGETEPVYRAVLSVTRFRPDADIWKRVLSGRVGQTLELTITRGIFFRGDLMEAPTVQPPIALTVAP